MTLSTKGWWHNPTKVTAIMASLTRAARLDSSKEVTLFVRGGLSATQVHIGIKMLTQDWCYSERIILSPLLENWVINLFKCFSERITTTTTMVQVRFKVCSEALEYRRRAIFRCKKFTKQLKVFAAMLAKRRRNRHTNRISLNQIAEKMDRYVRKKDLKDGKLFDKYMACYMKDTMQSLQGLKDANTKVNLLNSRIAHTKKYNLWLAAVRMFIKRIRVTLDLYEPWLHPDEVVKRLRIMLSQMTRYQTTTTAHWLQVEVKQMLEEALERLFWTN